MLAALDEGLGNLTATLRTTKRWVSTLFVLTSDNGAPTPGCGGAQGSTVRGNGWRVDKLANRTSFLRQLNALQDMMEVKGGNGNRAGVDPFIRDILVSGWDNDGRPVILLRNANEKTFDNKGKKSGNLVNLVYTIERAVAAIEAQSSAPDDKWTILLDFKDYSLFNAPPFEITKWTIKIVQDFYPERLHVAMMVDAPTLFWGAWKAASPFIDEVTKAKVVWISGALDSPERLSALQQYVPLDQLEQSVGGTMPLSENYDAAKYLAADPWRGGAKAAAAAVASDAASS